MFDWKSRLRNWPFWVAIAALIGMILADFGIAEAPAIVQKYLDLAYPVLIALGVIVNPTTKGIAD